METRRVAGRRRVGPCGRARYKWSGEMKDDPGC